MSRPVPSPATVSARTPDHLKKPYFFLDHLYKSGIFAEVSKRLWVRGRSDYTAPDALAFLVAFFASTRTYSVCGLRGFYRTNPDWTEALGLAAGRDRLMSSSALSRFLSRVTVEALQPFGSWLLREGSGALDLLRSPHTQSVDGRGERWLVFDIDPTRTAARQRALLEDEGCPPGERRLDDLCAAGRFGRKRGELGFSDYQLQHHGSGLVMDTSIRAGNGKAHHQLRCAFAATVDAANAIGHPLSRVLVRADGEFGHVPFLWDAKRAGIAFVTRCSRYAAVLTNPDVRRRMASAKWELVPDSGSGPRRYALDLGEVIVSPSADTLQDDGSRYEPISVRLVASRFVERSDRGVGFSVGDERIELFEALGADPAAWSAADVVATYYGRIAQENRFAQFDRESHSAVCSTTEGGEQLAHVAAALVWNLRIVEGERLNPVAAMPPTVQAPRAPSLVTVAPLVLPGPPLQEAAPADPEAAKLTGIDAVLAEIGMDARAKGRGLGWNPADRTVSSEGRAYRLGAPEHRRGLVRLRFKSQRERISFDLSHDEGTRVAHAWDAEPAASKRRRSQPRPAPPPPIRVVGDSTVDVPPVFAIMHPPFKPTAARRLLDEHFRCRDVLVRIVTPGAVAVPSHPLLEPDIRRRRHQRYSRQEQVARHAKPTGVHVEVRTEPTKSPWNAGLKIR